MANEDPTPDPQAWERFVWSPEDITIMKKGTGEVLPTNPEPDTLAAKVLTALDEL